MALRILRAGCKGEDVRVIQKALNRHGAGLDPDGDATWRKILEVTGG